MSTPSTKADGFISISFAKKANGAGGSFFISLSVKMSSQTLLFTGFPRWKNVKKGILLLKATAKGGLINSCSWTLMVSAW